MAREREQTIDAGFLFLSRHWVGYLKKRKNLSPRGVEWGGPKWLAVLRKSLSGSEQLLYLGFRQSYLFVRSVMFLSAGERRQRAGPDNTQVNLFTQEERQLNRTKCQSKRE